MIPDLDPIEWAALGWGGALVALVGAYCLVAPALSNYNANRFARETERIKADEQQRRLMERLNEAAAADAEPAPVKPERPGISERLTRAAHWLAVKATRADRTGAR